MAATVALAASAAIAPAAVIGSQWSWVSVYIDTQTRTGLTGPAGTPGLTWNDYIGNAGLTKTNLLNSNGVATTVGFKCNGKSVDSDWVFPELKLLTGSAYNFNFDTPMTAVISGLTSGKKYTLYLCGYVPNSGGSRNVCTTTNPTTNGGTQVADNEGANAKRDRCLRGINYVKFENIEPDALNSIHLTLTSGSSFQRAYLSGFQLVENLTPATNPFTAGLAGYIFTSIPSADLSLDGDPDRNSYTNAEDYISGTSPTLANRLAGVFMTETWGGICQCRERFFPREN